MPAPGCIVEEWESLRDVKEWVAKEKAQVAAHLCQEVHH